MEIEEGGKREREEERDSRPKLIPMPLPRKFRGPKYSFAEAAGEGRYITRGHRLSPSIAALRETLSLGDVEHRRDV